jgi:GNAT superfamily N-acetyltransferase
MDPIPGDPAGLALDRFREGDVPGFLSLADREGWVCDEWEFNFLLAAADAGCFVLRAAGEAVAFVTTCRHERSAWLGNLLVAPDWRGKGLGRRLMEASLSLLDGTGTATTWLTASAEGKPLYEKLGFRACDEIRRWRGTGSVGSIVGTARSPLAEVLELDRLGWGDRRERLVQATKARGALLSLPGGFLVVQGTGAGVQLGPWGGEAQVAEPLLGQGLAVAGKGTPLFLDSPAGNRAAERLLAAAGLSVSGTTVLMYRGEKPAYRPAGVYALASMGSMG